MGESSPPLVCPVLVFGGCYSNLEATVALRRAAERLGIPAHNTICTGDVMAYRADPVATVDFVRDCGVHVVMGNCEGSLGWSKDDCGLSPSCDVLLSRELSERGTPLAANSVRWNSAKAA